jgi:NAD(P)-dependent dehydrogenase (short-subunit alcohol dehydrogenase family)
MQTLDGMRIAVVDAEGALGAPAVAALTAAGAAVAPVALEVDGDATAGVERAIATLGGLDVLANLTKPTSGDMPALEVARADFESLFKRCLRTTRTSNQAAFRHMTASGGGHVVNHAEMAGEIGESGRALPATVAQAVVAWSRAAAGAWFFQGVRVNIFQPNAGASMSKTVIPTLMFLLGGDAALHGTTVTC